jgi:hypothetical protein
MTIHKIIHVYYLNKSHGSLNKSFDYSWSLHETIGVEPTIYSFGTLGLCMGSDPLDAWEGVSSGTLGLCMGSNPLDAWEGVRQIDRDRDRKFSVECEIDGRIS